jgi:hypothetical protein
MNKKYMIMLMVLAVNKLLFSRSRDYDFYKDGYWGGAYNCKESDEEMAIRLQREEIDRAKKEKLGREFAVKLQGDEILHSEALKRIQNAFLSKNKSLNKRLENKHLTPTQVIALLKEVEQATWEYKGAVENLKYEFPELYKSNQ